MGTLAVHLDFFLVGRVEEIILLFFDLGNYSPELSFLVKKYRWCGG